MKNVVLLKLGGSLITDKTKPFALRIDHIQHAAAQIKEALDENPNLHLIIATGTGSFGHYPAIEYGVEKTIKTETQKKGVMVIREAVIRLCGIVVYELLQAGVKATAFSPGGMFISKSHQITHHFVEPVLKSLSTGIIPVLHGDMIIDDIDGAMIMSSDRLLVWLTDHLQKQQIKVDKIIHAGITDGVLDKEGNVISHISSTDGSYFNKTEGYDVTGGMKHKVEESLQLSAMGVPTYIVNGTQENVLKHTLLGSSTTGTLIKK